jgi:hypothetical protein
LTSSPPPLAGFPSPGAAAKPQTVVIEIPGLRLISEGNAREHWAKRRKRRQWHEVAVIVALDLRRRRELDRLPLPYHVRWTRVGKKLLDPDAVGSSFKFVQDELCRFLGVDDGDTESISFEYRQEKGKAYAVRIEISGGAA